MVESFFHIGGPSEQWWKSYNNRAHISTMISEIPGTVSSLWVDVKDHNAMISKMYLVFFCGYVTEVHTQHVAENS